MRRGSDQRSADLAAKLRAHRAEAEDLARAQAHGSTALRDRAGNSLLMNPDAPFPLLRAAGVDVATGFYADALRVVSPDTQESRDVVLRKLFGEGGSFSGDVDITGHLGVVGLLEADSMGTKTLGVGTVNGATVNLGNVRLTGNSAVFPGIGVNADPGGSWRGRYFYGGTFYGVVEPSDPLLKERIESITDGLERVRELDPFRYTWLDADRDRDVGLPPGSVHAGLDAVNVAAAIPEAARSEQERAGDAYPQIDEELDGNRPISTGVRTYDDRSVIAHLVSAVKTLDAQLDAERTRNDELEARIDALERARG